MFYPRLQKSLAGASPWVLNAFILMTAFSTYFCAYGFRRPMSAAQFLEEAYWGVDWKLLILISQILGYASAKFVGIKWISEVPKDAGVLVRWIMGLLTLSGLSWFLFALLPPPWAIVFVFVNGFPLGLIWGLVFSFLEGRQYTEILGAGLSASFIFAGAFSLVVGNTVLDWGITESWMPFYASMIYWLPMLVSVWLLGHTPAPSPEDIALRKVRKPMDAANRKAFFARFGWGLMAMTLAYMFLNAYREIRSNFASEIVGKDNLDSFSQLELLVSIVLLVILGLFYRIKNNKHAFLYTTYTITLGSILVGIATLAYHAQWIDAWVWMFLVGLGTYIGYIPMGTFLFDRLLGASNWPGTAGFLIYFIDTFAYLATISLLIVKNFVFKDFNWINFLGQFGYTLALANAGLMLVAILFFRQSLQAQD